MKTTLFIIAFIAISWFAAYPVAAQQEPSQARLGDVNRDGACNVLDVQGAIAQALRTQDRTRECDVDENGEVDIFDVQTAINTALGTGGLLQRVRGVLAAGPATLEAGVRVCAVAQTGECVEGEVDKNTGEFTLMLRVKTAWALAFLAPDGSGGTEAGSVAFPIEGETSSILPIPAISEGDTLELGSLQFAHRITAQQEIRTLLQQINRRRAQADADGDGVPDFAARLLNRVQSATDVPSDLEPTGLRARVAQCLGPDEEVLTTPGLEDANQDGVPDFVAPLMACIQANVEGWFEDNGHHGPPDDGNHDGTPDYVERIMAHIRDGIPEWAGQLQFREMQDANGNGVADYIEPVLGQPGGPNATDADGDGTPDFAQDGDGDGIPNCLDDDARTPENCDGDGIPNVSDEDDDNDGVPDYADSDPCGGPDVAK